MKIAIFWFFERRGLEILVSHSSLIKEERAFNQRVANSPQLNWNPILEIKNFIFIQKNYNSNELFTNLGFLIAKPKPTNRNSDEPASMLVSWLNFCSLFFTISIILWFIIPAHFIRNTAQSPLSEPQTVSFMWGEPGAINLDSLSLLKQHGMANLRDSNYG